MIKRETINDYIVLSCVDTDEKYERATVVTDVSCDDTNGEPKIANERALNVECEYS